MPIIERVMIDRGVVGILGGQLLSVVEYAIMAYKENCFLRSVNRYSYDIECRT